MQPQSAMVFLVSRAIETYHSLQITMRIRVMFKNIASFSNGIGAAMQCVGSLLRIFLPISPYSIVHDDSVCRDTSFIIAVFFTIASALGSSIYTWGENGVVTCGVVIIITVLDQIVVAWLATKKNHDDG